MSDSSGFSGLPPGVRPGDIFSPQGMIELKAKIIALRGELKALEARMRIEGEILRQNPDGTTVIKTDKGEITVQLRGRGIPPPGTRVVVDIPPPAPDGTPPRQVTVTPLPEQPAPVKPQAPPPTPDIRSDAPPPRALPRLDVNTAEELARQIAALPPEQRPQAVVKPEDIIRLLPLPPQEAEQIARAALEIIRTQMTALPPQPQTDAPAELFRQVSPQLVLPYTEHAVLKELLPQHPPLYTQATAAPVPQRALETLPLAARTPVQQLIQYILQASQPGSPAPFEPAVPPVLIAPETFIPAGTLQKISAAALQNSLFIPASGETPVFPVQTAIPGFAVPGTTTPLRTQAQNFLDVRVQEILPPSIKLLPAGAQPAMPAMPSPLLLQGPAGSLTADIVGMTPQNLPVLSFFLPQADTPAHFVLQFEALNLPVGAQIRMTPLPGAGLAAPALPNTPFIPFEFFGDFSWPALEEITRALQQAAPQAAQTLANMSANASTPSRLPAAALFFLAVVRSGDLSGWLGDKGVDALRRIGKSDLIARLARDVSGLQRTAMEPAAQDWRATALPMMSDGQLHKMMLYYRHDRGAENDDDPAKRGTRFIFDLNLSRMGDVQIDGLHRPQPSAGGRLDLIVRTKKPLSAAMHQSMRRAYKEALAQAGASGDLSFQNRAEQFVKIEMPKTAAASG